MLYGLGLVRSWQGFRAASVARFIVSLRTRPARGWSPVSGIVRNGAPQVSNTGAVAKVLERTMIEHLLTGWRPGLCGAPLARKPDNGPISRKFACEYRARNQAVMLAEFRPEPRLSNMFGPRRPFRVTNPPEQHGAMMRAAAVSGRFTM